MKIEKLDTFKKGWFIGSFDPSIYKTDSAEIGIKLLKAGEINNQHYHKIATEISCIIEGIGVTLPDNTERVEGDILIVEPYEAVGFKAITDVKLVVIKLPGSTNDKYEGVYNGTNLT